jgi:hypothetical protein
MSSTDYLVICGRASARSRDPASATLESLLDSSKHIITQLLCLAQRSPMQKFQPQLRICALARANCTMVKRTFSLRYCSAYSALGLSGCRWRNQTLEILWQLPVKRVDLLATDVADDYGRTIWRHATPFAPL